MSEENTSTAQDEATILETIQEMNDLMIDMRSDLAKAKLDNN